jgi:hypothetical protein
VYDIVLTDHRFGDYGCWLGPVGSAGSGGDGGVSSLSKKASYFFYQQIFLRSTRNIILKKKIGRRAAFVRVKSLRTMELQEILAQTPKQDHQRHQVRQCKEQTPQTNSADRRQNLQRKE